MLIKSLNSALSDFYSKD